MLFTIEVTARVKVYLVPIWNNNSCACILDNAVVVHVFTPVGKPLIDFI